MQICLRIDLTGQAHRHQRRTVLDERKRNFALVVSVCPCRVVIFFFVMGVRPPNACKARQDESIDDAPCRPKNAHDAIRFGMLAPAATEAVDACKGSVDDEPRFRRDICTDDGIERCAPQAACGKHRAVMRDQLGLGADDPKTAEAVAERNRNQLCYTRIVTQTERLVQWNVARRRVDMKDARKDQPERTPLGSYDEINALRTQYEARIKALEARLEAVQAQPAAPTPLPAPAAGAPAPVAAATGAVPSSRFQG